MFQGLASEVRWANMLVQFEQKWGVGENEKENV